MNAEFAALANAVVPYVTAAVGAYGAAVLTRLQEVAADATVGVGGTLLRRLLQRAEPAPALEAAVLDLAEDPDNGDRQSALRLQIRKVLATDERLAADVAGIVQAAGTTVTASAPRSVAAQTISNSVVSTGDDAEITR